MGHVYKSHGQGPSEVVGHRLQSGEIATAQTPKINNQTDSDKKRCQSDVSQTEEEKDNNALGGHMQKVNNRWTTRAPP
jgi:hypothetical protein